MLRTTLENGLDVANLRNHPCRIPKKSIKRVLKRNLQGKNG